MAAPDRAASPPQIVGALDADGPLPAASIDLDGAVASSLAGLGACYGRSGGATEADADSREDC